MNIYDRMRDMITALEEMPQDRRRYQVRHAASQRHGIIVDTWEPGTPANLNATATGLVPQEAALTLDTANIVAALLNLGYPMPVNPAVAQLVMAFMPETENRDTAREDLFDSLQVMVQAALQRELPDSKDEADLPEVALRIRQIVERHFEFQPAQGHGHRVP